MATVIKYNGAVRLTINAPGTYVLPTKGKLMATDLIVELDGEYSVKLVIGDKAIFHARGLDQILKCAGTIMYEDITVLAYRVSDLSTNTVTVYNGELPPVIHTLEPSDTLLLSPIDVPGKIFSHWERNGRIRTYNRDTERIVASKRFPAGLDGVYRAVYVDSEDAVRNTPEVVTVEIRPFYTTKFETNFIINFIPRRSPAVLIRAGYCVSSSTYIDPSVTELTIETARTVKDVSASIISQNQRGFEYASGSSSSVGVDFCFVRPFIVDSIDGIEQLTYGETIKFPLKWELEG